MKKIFQTFLFFIIGISIFSQPVVNFTINQPSLCAPVNISFTSTITGCTGPIIYSWTSGNGDISSNANPVFNYSTGGTYIVTLMVTCNGVSATKTATINVYNSPTANFVTTTQTGCSPYTATFTDLTTIGDAQIQSWLWYAGDGLAETSQNASHLYNNGGSYNVSLKVTDANGCSSQKTQNSMILVANKPQIDFTSTNNEWCHAPHTVNFQANIITSFGLNSVLSWNWGDGTIIEHTNPISHTYNNTGSFNVSLSVTDEYGCTNELTKNNFVNIRQTQPTYSIVEGNIVCIGMPVHFQNETSYNCLWNFGGSSTSTLNFATHTFTTAGDKTITFTVNPGGECEASTTFNILVETIQASFTTSPTNLFSCSTPFVVNFTNTSSSNATSFLYTFQDGTTSSEANPSHTFTHQGVFTPILTATSAHGCSNSFIGPTITIQPPNVAFEADTIEGCAPLLVNFTYTGTTPLSSITNWSWDFDNGQSISSGTNTASATYTPGTYHPSLTITDNNNCTSTTSIDINIGEVFIPHGIGVVTNETHLTLPNHYLCPQDSVELYNPHYNNPDITDFSWWIDSTDNNSTQEYEPWQFDKDTGWITIHMITNYNGCRDTLLWDSVYINGPIIKGINKTFDCLNPLEQNFTVDTLLADKWDWHIYKITGGITTNLHTVLNSTSKTLTYTFPSNGSYWVKVIAYNNTSGCDFKDSIQVNITSPRAFFSLINSRHCSQEDIVLYAGASTNATEYYWDFGDGTNSGWISNATTIHSYSTLGHYTITLKVRDANNCEHQTSNNIHIIGPDISITADKVYGCDNLEVNFTENVTADEDILWIKWRFGDGESTISSGTVSHTYTSLGTYSVSVTARTISGCETTKVYENMIKIEHVQADISVDKQIICAGDSINFSSLETNDTYNYTWNFGDGTIINNNQSNQTHQYINGGVFDVKLLVDNNLGCKDSIFIESYIIAEKVTANFTLAQNNIPCYPHEVEITNNCQIIPSTTTVYYKWDMGNSDTLLIEDPVYLYTRPGNYNITLNIRTSHNCTSRYSLPLTINGPYAEAYISDTIACVGENITFRLINQENVNDFTWVVGGGQSYNIEEFTHSYNAVNPQGYYPVSLILRSLGCEVSFNYNIYVFDVKADFLITDIDTNLITEICSNEQALLICHSENAYYRTWYLNNDIINQQDSIILRNFINNGNTSENTNISLVISDTHSCRDSISKSLTINPLPQIRISNDSIICHGDTIRLYANGGIKYEWSPNKYISDTTSNTPIIYPDTDIQYTVKVTDSKNCSKSDSVLIKFQKIPEIELNPLRDTIIIGDTVFINLQTNDNNLTYQWSPNKSISCDNCPQPYLNPLATTQYLLNIKDSLKCYSLDYFIDIIVIEKYSLDVPTAFTPLGYESNRTVYARGFGIKNLLQFRIYNRWGEEVFYTNSLDKGWNGYYNGKLQDIDTYSYFVEAEMFDGSIKTKKGHIMLIK